MNQISWLIENFLINFSFLFLLLTMIFYWIYLGSFFKNFFFKVGKFSNYIANFSLFISLILRWSNSGHFPLSNREIKI